MELCVSLCLCLCCNLSLKSADVDNTVRGICQIIQFPSRWIRGGGSAEMPSRLCCLHWLDLLCLEQQLGYLARRQTLVCRHKYRKMFQKVKSQLITTENINLTTKARGFSLQVSFWALTNEDWEVTRLTHTAATQYRYHWTTKTNAIHSIPAKYVIRFIYFFFFQTKIKPFLPFFFFSKCSFKSKHHQEKHL